MTGSRRVVYTALIGGYEVLREQPLAEQSDIPFICFTDDPDLRSDTWDVRLVEPSLEMDPTRSARGLKIVGHDQLEGVEESLWIDARVELRVDPHAILDDWLDGTDLAAARHSFRPDIVSEFHAVLVGGLDDASRIYEQLTHYTVLDSEALLADPPWTALLARRHTSSVGAAMQTWWHHVLRYSRRDQLSLVHVLRAAGLPLRLVELDNYESDVHRWHGGQGRPTRPPLLSISSALQPPTARIGELQAELAQLATQTARANTAREVEVARLRRQVARLNDRLAHKNRRIEELRAMQHRPQGSGRAADI